jgi:hypothetical protein
MRAFATTVLLSLCDGSFDKLSVVENQISFTNLLVVNPFKPKLM